MIRILKFLLIAACVGWTTKRGYVAASGEPAYLIEELQIGFDGEDGNRVGVPGKIVTVWRKNRDGDWKNVADIYNFNRQ